MANEKKDFFNLSEEEEIQTSPHVNTSTSESELIAFTDNIMTLIRAEDLPYVIVHVYGTKARRMNAQEIHGVFNWNPDPTDIDSFHLPTAAKANIPELESGTDYFALVRTPENEKIGGVLISIKKTLNNSSNDIWKSNKNLPTTMPKSSVPISRERVKNDDSMEALMAEQTHEMFKIVFENYMNRFKTSLEKTLSGGENEEISSVRKELQTLKGVLLEDNKRKEEESKRSLLDKKDKEIDELKQQIELIHQKLNNPNDNRNQQGNQKEKGLSSLLGIVKSLADAKEVVFPILEGLGVQVPKLNGGNQIPINMPPLPNQLRGGDVYRDPQNVNQVFNGFDEDDISFSGFEDSNVSKNNNISNNIDSNLEVDPMSYKTMANSIMTIIFKKFRITDVVKEVIPMVKEEVSKDFWSLVKNAGFDENFVLGIGLKNPGEMADNILKHIPTDLLNMVQNNLTGENYTDVIRNLLIEVIRDSAKKYLE